MEIDSAFTSKYSSHSTNQLNQALAKLKKNEPKADIIQVRYISALIRSNLKKCNKRNKSVTVEDLHVDRNLKVKF